jgi:hypothetical protein
MDISQAFANLNSRFVELVNGHDAHRRAALFSDDAVLVPAGQPTVVGREVATKIWNHLDQRRLSENNVSGAARRLPQWVKLRRTQPEQMSSGLPLKADIARYSPHVANVPTTEVPLSITSSSRASTSLRWSFGQPGSPQSFFFVSQKVFALPRAPHVLESGNT